MRKIKGAILAMVVLLALCVPFALAGAADVVKFTDPVLEILVRKQMGKMEGDITVADAEAVTELFMNREADGDPAIQDISSLAPFVNLSYLSLIGNEVTNIGVLEVMWNLKFLDLGGNQVHDLSPLSKLPLESLAVWDNGVTDISALAPIETLNSLMLNDNQIVDFSPIQNLTNLQYLYVRENATMDYSVLQGIFPNLLERDFEILTTPFDPAEVIVFNDPVLEGKVREAVGIHEGDITAADAALLLWLNADVDNNLPDNERIHDVSALRYFVNLQGVTMNGSAISDISALEGLTKLQTLWLLGSPLNDVGQLAGFTKLTRLGFDAGMQEFGFLKNMPELEELRIDGLRELPADLAQLRKLNIFCSLGGELSDIGLLAQCPSLTVIDLSWNMIADLSPLANLPLTELYLQGNPIEDYSPIAELYPNLVGRNFEYYELSEPENPDEVITFPDPVLEQKIRAAIGIPEGNITSGDAAKVTELSMGNEWQEQIPADTQITNLQGIESFINLRKLDVSFSAISDIGALSTLTELRDLNLGGNNVQDITPISGLTKLESLTLFGGSFKDITPLANLTSLRFLHLSGIQLPDISPLAGLTQLDNLYLSSCGIENIGPLAGLTNMYRLELAYNKISDLSALSGMRNLHALKLNNNPISDYSPVAELYAQLEEKDFELGQSNAALIPLQPENPDAEVPINDAALEAILREASGVFDRPLTQKDLCTIGKIVPGDNGLWQNVSDLSPLQYCLNLEGLIINGSQVQDLDKLSMLEKLSVLVVTDSRVANIGPLAALADQLRVLELRNNQISDISVVQSMVNLESLDLSGNQIADFSPLYGLTHLGTLMINHNAGKDASGLKDIAGSLKETDFDPSQPLDLNKGNGGDSGLLQPENPDTVIVFTDPVFELRIHKALNKPEGELTAGEAAQVDTLSLGNEWQESFPEGSQFSNLNGIEYFINLRSLDIAWNTVEDISKLAGLTQLEYLRAYGNRIADITPLAGLTKLNNVNIGGNQVKDISPLSGLANLGVLYLDGNQIADIAALSGLTGLKSLFLKDNPIADYSPIKDIYSQLTEKDFDMK